MSLAPRKPTGARVSFSHAARRPLYKFLLPTKHTDRNSSTHHCITLPQNTHSERVKHPTEDHQLQPGEVQLLLGRETKGGDWTNQPLPHPWEAQAKGTSSVRSHDSTILKATKFHWALDVSFDCTGTYLAVSCPSLPPQY